MASYYILKPLRDAYFLHAQDIRQVALVQIVVALVTFLTVQVYAALTRRVPGRRIATWAFGSFVLTVVALWGVLKSGAHEAHHVAFVWFLYVWVSVFSVFAVTLFWSIAHDIFTPAEGSRYYGIIGAAGILGGFVGGLVTSMIVETIGLPNLFLASAALLVPCVAIAAVLAARAPSLGRSKDQRPAGEVSALGVFRGSAYLRAIFVYVFLYQAVSIVVDQQTKLIVKQAFQTEESLAGFQARIYAATNIIGTVVNLAVTGFVQTRFGPMPGLLVLPLCAVVAAVGFHVMPTIRFAAVVTTLGLAAGYSIQQSSKELLYLPVPSADRYVAKAFIDTFGFRLGNGLTSVWLFLAVPALGGLDACGAMALCAAGMVACALWLVPRHRAMVATSATPAR